MNAPTKPRYTYAAEKFSDARKILMLPHPKGVDDSIFKALMECRHGLHDVDKEKLRDPISGFVRRLEELMELDHRKLTEAQQFEVSRLVDELAHWFSRQNWAELKS